MPFLSAFLHKNIMCGIAESGAQCGAKRPAGGMPRLPLNPSRLIATESVLCPYRLGCINRGMAFSEEIMRAAWYRSGGRCECRNERHGHAASPQEARPGERCPQSLLWYMRGSDSAFGGWDLRRRTTWGTDVLANCEILCAACQRPPQPFG